MTTTTHTAAKIFAKFKPSKDGAYPTGRRLPGQWEQNNRQEWAERGTIDGEAATVFYLFDNSEVSGDGSDMPFDADHVSQIKID